MNSISPFGFLFLMVLFGTTVALVAKLKGKPCLGSGIKAALLALFSLVGLPGLGVVLWLLALVIVAVSGGGDSGNENSSAAKHFGQDAQYAYVAGNTGIAVDPAKQIVRLKEGKAVAEYPFSQVRGWRTNLSSGGDIIHAGGTGFAGLNAGMAAAGHNARNARENRKASGLFVSVRDIDRPEWRIDMPNEKNQKRWMEILRQTINND